MFSVVKGNKMNNIDVVYTMWANLKKTAGMDVGQVGFHKQKEVFFQLVFVMCLYVGDQSEKCGIYVNLLVFYETFLSYFTFE